MGGRAFPLGDSPLPEVLGVHDQSPWQSSPRECGGKLRDPSGAPHFPPCLVSPCPSAGLEAAVVALWPPPQAARKMPLTRAVRSANLSTERLP